MDRDSRLSVLLKEIEMLYADRPYSDLLGLNAQGEVPIGIVHYLLSIRGGKLPWKFFDLRDLMCTRREEEQNNEV